MAKSFAFSSKTAPTVNGLNSDHEHFLMGAVRGGNVEAAGALLDLGADWKIEESCGNENPAINAGFRTTEILKLFLDKGADIDALSSGGRTMLMNAASQTNPPTVKFLVDSGANVNIRNSKGESALSIAKRFKKQYWDGSAEKSGQSQEIIDYLVAHGAVR
jgi:ankyrin repeat protein